MSKEKSRPDDNRHCFTGQGRAYWFQKARGLQPAWKKGAEGHYIGYALDDDKLAQNNGGIASPAETSLPPRKRYFRFFSRAAQRRFGADAWLGNWWLDDETFSHIVIDAEDAGERLSRAVMRRLAVPPEWGNDCAHIVVATALNPVGAWVGRGKLAHAAGSPASKDRARDGGLTGDPPHRAPRQLFVPGDPQQIKRLFVPIAFDKTDEKGGIAFRPAPGFRP